MKSRTSFFNLAVFKKNLTRFAPAWGLYTVFLLMALLLLIDDGSRWYASNLADFIQIMAAFTPCYALICAQLLFGDLYNTRMCNALHALPLRRETWFVTNIISGFVFQLIPTVIFTALAALVALLACYPGDWISAMLWLLGVNLQFMCFFGIAVFSAFCVGSRFAQAVVYGIVNFGALVVGWLADTIFVPMYYGIKLNLDPVLWFSPMARMLEERFVRVNQLYDTRTEEWTNIGIELEGNFLYYFIVAAIGIGFILLALHLYRRRKLECAGDFLAFPGTEPVFLVVYTVIMGTLFQFIGDDLFGMDMYLFLFLGLAVGWFTGKMLLERTPRVFKFKNILRFGALVLACVLILFAAALDPFGIECWIPDADKVESVTIADGHYSYHHSELTVDDPAEIQKIIAIHRQALEDPLEQNIVSVSTWEVRTDTIEYIKEGAEPMNFSISLTFTYHMKSGRTVNRYYNVWMGGEAGAYLKTRFSSPEVVLGYPDAASFLAENRTVMISDTWQGDETYITTQADLTSLYQAIAADCEAGNMAQLWEFHDPDISLYWIQLEETEINVFSNCENTLNWLRDYGLDVDDLIETKYEIHK